MVGTLAMAPQEHTERTPGGGPALSSSSSASPETVMVGTTATNLHHVSATINQPKKSCPGPIRVVSFDLDNTLWCTLSTLTAAQHATQAFFEARHIAFPRTSESVMKELFQANRARYAPLLGANATCPSQMSELRIDSWTHLLQHYHGYTAADARQLATEALQVQADARHDAIPHHLAASGVVQTLERIRKVLPHVRLGAITDGNADPTRVPELSSYFDFVIQAETVGCTKPDCRIYTHAIQQVQSLSNEASSDGNSEPIRGAEGWVHIGDDFVKDIVGAHEAGMATIWCRELIHPEKLQNKPTTTLGKDISSGWGCGSDHLGVESQSVRADAVVDSFADIVDILERWHKQSHPR